MVCKNAGLKGSNYLSKLKPKYRACIGGQKCATSMLYQFLFINSESFLPPSKEQNIIPIDNSTQMKLKDGLNYDFSTDTIYSDYALDRLLDSKLDSRIVIIGRNPIERAASAYWHYCKTGVINKNENLSEEFKKHPYLINKSLIGKRAKKWISILGKKNVFLSDFSLITQDLNEVFKISQWLEISLIKNPKPLRKIDPRRESKLPYIEKKVHNISRILRKILPRMFYHFIKKVYYKSFGKFFYKPINISEDKVINAYILKEYGTLLNSDRALFLELLKVNRPNLKSKMSK